MLKDDKSYDSKYLQFVYSIQQFLNDNSTVKT